MASPFTLDNPIFCSFALCSAFLGGKLVLNSAWTSFNRLTRQVMSAPEDIKAFGGKVTFQDERVERLRRMHQNDLENYVPFFLLGLLYVSTNPDEFEAWLLFRVSQSFLMMN